MSRFESDNAFNRMRSEVTQRLTERNKKYGIWLKAVRYSGLALGSRDKGRMLEADYLWMREIDDIADGDLRLPEGYASPADYVSRKLVFLHKPGTPTDDVEKLILLCSELSEKTGLDLTNARQAIVESMLFDARRLGTGQVYPDAELQEYFYKCDIAGTAAGTLALFGEDPQQWPYVYETGRAVRIYYNVRDYDDDIAAGLVNISQEDCNRLGITSESLHDSQNPSIQAWFQEQAQLGLSLLDSGGHTMRRAGFGRIGVGFVHLYHERPARAFLQNIIY